MRENITPESLGADATEEDVRPYQDAVDRIAAFFDGDQASADAWLWGSGDYQRRLDAAVCIYCGALVTDGTAVPGVADDPAWGLLAREHEDGCEWIGTRAHRLIER